tara:strand:+ start:458 stop:1213 length:756 start_codon:yes stop_codon:yes gene_type:complete
MAEGWTSNINYSICQQLKITILEYCVCDIINQMVRKDKAKSVKVNQSCLANILGVSRQTICNTMVGLGKRKLLVVKGKDLRARTYSVKWPQQIQGAPVKAKKKQPKATKEKKINTGSIFPGFMNDYYEFFQKRTDIKPKITGADGKALKEIIKHLISITKDKFKDMEDPEVEKKAREGWQVMLNNWGIIDPFLQKQIKLIQINGNFNNIIENLKNGKRKPLNHNKQSGVSDLKSSIYKRSFGTTNQGNKPG